MAKLFVPEVNAILSRATGYVSLYIWIVSSLPQIVENYQLKSGEGLAPLMFVIWLTGDIMNLSGAILQNVVWTAILTAIWYTLSDIVIISQIYYYRFIYNPAPSHDSCTDYGGQAVIYPNERTDLLNSSQGNSHHNHYGYDHHNHEEDGNDSDSVSITSSAASATSILRKDLVRTVLLLVAVVVLPVAWELWHLDYSAPVKEPSLEINWKAQAYAYFSAFLYLSARFPQFIKNYRDKSTYGLSMGVFILSTLGNTTYAASILLYSTDRTYLIANAPFLLGSLGTLTQDLFMFYQFYLYSGKTRALCSHDNIVY